MKAQGEEIPGNERQFFLILFTLLWISSGFHIHKEIQTGVYVDGGLNSH